MQGELTLHGARPQARRPVRRDGIDAAEQAKREARRAEKIAAIREQKRKMRRLRGEAVQS